MNRRCDIAAGGPSQRFLPAAPSAAAAALLLLLRRPPPPGRGSIASSARRSSPPRPRRAWRGLHSAAASGDLRDDGRRSRRRRTARRRPERGGGERQFRRGDVRVRVGAPTRRGGAGRTPRVPALGFDNLGGLWPGAFFCLGESVPAPPRARRRARRATRVYPGSSSFGTEMDSKRPPPPGAGPGVGFSRGSLRVPPRSRAPSESRRARRDLGGDPGGVLPWTTPRSRVSSDVSAKGLI